MKKLISILFAILLVIPLNAQVNRSKPPEPGPPPEIKLGKYEKFELPNGLKVFIVENHKLPRVSFSLQIDRDPILEGDTAGYVSAAGQLLRTGNNKQNKRSVRRSN